MERPALKNVIDKDDDLAVDVERNPCFKDIGQGLAHSDVVTVHGNVERAERRQETGFFLNAFHEAFRKGDSAAVYADEYEIILIGILVFVTDFLRDFVDQCGNFLRIHQVGFVWSGIHVHRFFPD